MASTNPARGMRDFLPADVRKRNYVINIIKEVYESYGFEPLETPAVENIETLLGKYGEEGNQLVFKILKRGEKLDLAHASSEGDLSDLALRYDLTVPLARVVANHKNDLPKFFKRYQIQPVWRADRPARGRFREFYQCDVDAIGSESMVVEAELVSAVLTAIFRLGFRQGELRLNHRDLLTALLMQVKIPPEQYIAAITVLDKLDKIGADGVITEMKRLHLEGAISLLEFILAINDRRLSVLESKEDGGSYLVQNKFILENMRGFLLNSELGQKALDKIQALLGLLEDTGFSHAVRFDPTLARGLSYYTGSIMEFDIGKKIGSIGGGGRYDRLIGMFGKEQIPACGFSLGLERILVVMEERGMFPPEIAESTAADVMVTIWSEETIPASLKLAANLRKQGVRVIVYPEVDKLGKQIKYADSIRVSWVCVLGESEIAERKVTLKNMQSGEQHTISAAEIASKIAE